jgi:hypothetical protein
MIVPAPLKFPEVFADLTHVLPSGTTTDRPVDDPRTILEALVRDFERDVAANRKLIHEQLDNDPEAFYRNSIDLLKNADESRGFQHLVVLLVSNGLLLRALCDPRLSREQAMALGRAATRANPMADVEVSRALADSTTQPDGPVSLEAAPRLMEILAEISDGSRIAPSLMRLMRHSNPHIRSKAVLMIGRGNLGVRWVRGRLTEADPRIRANAIEALWRVNSPEAPMLLRYALTDSNNRVVGNALLGLYLLGDCSVIPEIVKMAGNESPLFRASAAWAMGETGDSRFAELLVKMLVESNTTVRKTAFAALVRIKAASAQTVLGPRLRMAGIMPNQPGDLKQTQRKVHLAIAPDNGQNQPRILATEFLLSENGQSVLSYKVTEKPPVAAMSVIFVLPRAGVAAATPWNQGAVKCLAWKRPSDLWASLPFLPSGDPEAMGHAIDEPPRFTANTAALAASLAKTPGRLDCSELWETLWRCVRPDQAGVRGKRHLIVVANEQVDRIAGDSLIANIVGSRTSLQVISSLPNPAVDDFCQKAKGRFHTFENESDIPDLVQQAYLNLLTHYEISYQLVSKDATEVRARVQTASGWGEVKIPIPREPSPST